MYYILFTAACMALSSVQCILILLFFVFTPKILKLFK